MYNWLIVVYAMQCIKRMYTCIYIYSMWTVLHVYLTVHILYILISYIVFHIHIREFWVYVYSYIFLQLFHVFATEGMAKQNKTSEMFARPRQWFVAPESPWPHACKWGRTVVWITSQRQIRHHFKIRWLLWSNFSCCPYFDNIATKVNTSYHINI